MKLSKNLGRIATTFLATAMLASVAAVPAFADVDDLNVAEGKVTIPVNLAVDSTETTPAMSTVYTVGYLGEGDVVHEGDLKGQEGDIKDVAGNSTDLTVSIAANTTPTPVSETNCGIVSDNLVLDFDTTAFGDRGPGIYEYTLTETANTLPTGVDADGPFLLRVWVVNANEDAPDGTYEIAGAELYVKDGDGYSNTKQDSIDKEYTTYSLTLTKKIDGLFASKDTPFEFVVQFTSAEGYVGKFAYTYGGTQASGSNGGDVTFDNETVDNQETANVTLKHGATVTFTGIPEDVALNIAENADGYTAVITSNDTDDTTVKNSKTYMGDMRVSGSGSNIEVEYVNTSDDDNIVATGVMMDIAPYALLVVAAAAGCFVFLRKRRED